MPKGEITNPQEQLFDLQEKSRHIKRKAFDAEEGHKHQLSRFRDTVSNGLKEYSIRQRQIDEKSASALHAALKSRSKSLEDCDDLMAAAVGELQGGKPGSNDGVPTSAESPQEVPQPRRSIFGRDSSSGGNHIVHPTSGSRR